MSKTANWAIAIKATYEGSVISRAVARAGLNQHLKGHIHEILVKDARNARNILFGQVTDLTRSITAPCVDLVTTKAGKVIERIQVKDAISPSSINKLIRQVSEGKYRSARLIGSTETTHLANEAFKKAGLSKRMVSSGISSKTTTRLAQRAGATGSGTLGGAVTQAARSGGAIGAAVEAGMEMISGISDMVNGRRNAGEVAISVVKAGAKGYATGAAASAAATASGAVIVGGLGTGLTAVAAPVAIAIGVGYAVSKFCDWLLD